MPLPNAVPGLLAWGRADDAGAADGATVTSITDRVSGTAYTSLTATAGSGPVYRASGIGGRPALEFAGTRAGALRAADPITIPTTGWTAWAVAYRGATGGATPVIIGVDDANSGGNRLFQLGWGNEMNPRVLGFLSGATSVRGNDSGTAVMALTPALITGLEDSAGGDCLVNGASNGATASTAALQGGSRRLCVGAVLTNLATYLLVGQIAEWGFYDHALTASERSSLHSYLQDRYGITTADYVASAPTVTGAGTASVDSNTAAAGRIAVRGAAAPSAETSATSTGRVLVRGSGTATAESAADGTGKVIVRASGVATASTDAQGAVGATRVGGTGTAPAATAATATGRLIVYGQSDTLDVSSGARAAGRVRVTGAAQPTVAAAAAGAGSVIVRGSGVAEAVTAATSTGTIVDQRPAIDLNIRVEAGPPSAKVAFDRARPWRTSLEE